MGDQALPAEVRAWAAVVLNCPEALADEGPEVVAPLVALVDDEVAVRALQGLIDRAARQEACRAVIYGDHPRALAAVIAAGFEPAEDVQRALLWFLAGEWKRYDAIDPGGSLLTGAVASADDGLRSRLAAQAHRAGRPGLSAVVGDDGQPGGVEG